MTVVPSRPPDIADRPRWTTFMPFIHKSTSSSNAPILERYALLRSARDPDEVPGVKPRIRRLAVQDARSGELGRVARVVSGAVICYRTG